MKIAIVGPSPVPFTMGGMENMLSGLYRAINELTPHQAELIKLPVQEGTFWDLIDSYYQFYTLDLSHFDVILAAKYPAWMVQHDNCIFYVAHRLRGLYDTYHLMDLPNDVPHGEPEIDKIMNYMDANPGPSTLDDFFAMLFTLRKNSGRVESSYFSFPGPFIRRIVHYMDNYAFRARRAPRYAALSNTVKARADYFPADADVRTVYLPASGKSFLAGETKHIFMVSRLDAPKRIDLLIRAMKYVKADIPLYIAGTGPEKTHLESLAAGDDRIRFLGFVSDEDVDRYYADSLVIPYFPYEEDYGLITIEAMMHHKPVITTTDAGGPTEFVKDGETGFVVKPTPRAVAAQIDYLAAHPEEAVRMGEAGFETVAPITWEKTIRDLLEGYAPQREKKLTVTSTFAVYPPQGGGQARIYNLYKQLARHMKVDIVSYTGCDQSYRHRQLSSGFTEYQIPRDPAHQEKIWKLESVAKIPLTDVAEIRFGNCTAAYCETLKKSIEASDAVVISHPYLYETAKPYLSGKPFIYEAHNVESVMKDKMLPPSRLKKELVSLVFETEQACCNGAALVMACSEEDRQKLHELYGTPLEKIIVVPNGVDTSATHFCGAQRRLDNKKQFGLEHELIGIFMGSWHGPNLEACEVVFKVAEQCPDVKFMLMGSQCNYFQDRQLPDNVGLLGLVSEEEKLRVFSCADFALNPMYSGSGTNLKMFDYMAAGLPIITTAFGTRGIEDKSLFLLADDVEGMTAAIRGLQSGQTVVDVEKARTYAREHFDWEVIAECAWKEIERRVI